MLKIVRFSGLLFFVLMISCSPLSQYDDDEAAAVVKGQEITVGELRFLYPEDTALDYLDWLIKAELAKQEVINMNLDVSNQLDGATHDWFETLPPEDTKDDGGQQIREFAEAQAKKLSMTPEAFQRAYAKNINERNLYVMAYLEETLGKIKSNVGTTSDMFNDEVYEQLEKLYESNKDEIEILIK